MNEISDDKRKVKATPTKALFISMLTRDIDLIASIIDLVDNCTDGARAMRPDGSFLGLHANIEISGEHFSITDNCSGIDIDTARQYAFRFGRSDDAPKIDHAIGEFGIGMKRAIFKLGDHFRIESRSTRNWFVIDELVSTWASDSSNWEFAFTEYSDSDQSKPEDCGTSIRIDALYPEVKEKFSTGRFLNELQLQLQQRLQNVIADGMIVRLNGVAIVYSKIEFLVDPQLTPAYFTNRYNFDPDGEVNLSLYCGLGTGADHRDAGWHLFCNGRLIVEADKSELTGWGVIEDELEIKLPGYHNQFILMRGVAYFESANQGLLPWNTTKNGVNVDSPVFRSARIEMIRLMRGVIDFLNALKSEKEGVDDNSSEGPLESLVNGSKSAPINTTWQPRSHFSLPLISNDKPKERMCVITYKRSERNVRKAMRVLDTDNKRLLGEYTFDYFFDREVKG